VECGVFSGRFWGVLAIGKGLCHLRRRRWSLLHQPSPIFLEKPFFPLAGLDGGSIESAGKSGQRFFSFNVARGVAFKLP
jgi:hypothetical protein